MTFTTIGLRRPKKLMIVALIVGSFGIPSSAGAHPSVPCGRAFAGPDEPGFNIRAHGLSCIAARNFTRTYVRVGRVTGFSCRRRPLVDMLYRITCSRGAQWIAFSGGS